MSFSDAEVQSLVNLLFEYSDIFSLKDAQPEVAVGVEHTIDIEKARPINQPPYRVSPRERALINQLTSDMVQQGITQPSKSPWASPVVLVKKKEGGTRFISTTEN